MSNLSKQFAQVDFRTVLPLLPSSVYAQSHVFCVHYRCTI